MLLWQGDRSGFRQKLDNDLTMLGNKLNASFKGLKMA
jgi:hypothetical protein